MDAQKLQVKVFASHPPDFTVETVIPVFHNWIKEKVLKEVLIDVANYGHVPQGPGVALIGHGGDYFLDEEKGHLGLLYSRKRMAPKTDLLVDTFRRALHAAALLGKDAAFAGKLQFGGSRLWFRINDRLAAPNTDATFTAVRAELEAVAKMLFGEAPFTMTRIGEARELFTVELSCANAAEPATLLARLGGTPSDEGSGA